MSSSSLIKSALARIFTNNSIKSREDLDAWCRGRGGRKCLYQLVKRECPCEWISLNEPEATTRACYETMLFGYKHYKRDKSIARNNICDTSDDTLEALRRIRAVARDVIIRAD